MKLYFMLEKEVVHSVRYKEVDPAGGPLPPSNTTLTTIYVKKRAISKPYPEGIVVTLEFQQ